MSTTTSQPWYCVNVGGKVIDIIDPSIPCAVAQNVNNQVQSAVTGGSNVLTQLQALGTDFAWLQGNWARVMLALLAIVIVGLGFWVLASE